MEVQNAVVQEANLQGAKRETARGLTQAKLDAACGDANTALPRGLKIRARSREPK